MNEVKRASAHTTKVRLSSGDEGEVADDLERVLATVAAVGSRHRPK